MKKLQESKGCNRGHITHGIPPAPGTNQMDGFIEYHPLTH